MRTPSKIASRARSNGSETGPLRAASRAPRRQRGRDRVAALLASAAALFVERGYDATTMTEVAARAGASIGSLYLFFPTKQTLAQALLAEGADRMSARLADLRTRAAGTSAAARADALFEELAAFLAEMPAYTVLVDVPGDEGWRHSIRARRRAEIAALFAEAEPRLRPGQSERLAVIVPHLMRIILGLGREAPNDGGVIEEMRLMLRHHLER